MAESQISEFRYGFALLYELCNSLGPNLRGAPVLPSLQTEASLGWDAKLPTYGGQYYLQFKVSDYMFGANSVGRRSGVHTSPYYRCRIHKANNSLQHNRLIRLGLRNQRTFYVAPLFHRRNDLNAHFAAKTVAANSMWIPTSACLPIADAAQHFITFDPSTTGAWQWSNPAKVGADSIEGIRHIIATDAEKELTVERLQSIWEELVGLALEEAMPGVEARHTAQFLERRLDEDDRLDYAKRIATLASIAWEATVVFLGHD